MLKPLGVGALVWWFLEVFLLVCFWKKWCSFNRDFDMVLVFLGFSCVFFLKNIFGHDFLLYSKAEVLWKDLIRYYLVLK